MMGISFIVPLYNGEKTVKPCLESILSQDITIPWEIIVVNNASTDQGREICQSFSQLTVIDAPGKRNRSRARNLGAQQAKFPLLAFIDCDVILSKDWGSSLIKILKQPFSAVQTTIRTRYNKKEEETYYLYSTSPFQTMDTCSLLVLKEAFVNVGGFEEGLSRWEDSHFTMKLLSQGYSLMVIAPSKVIKFESRSQLKLYRRIFETGRSEGVAFKAWFHGQSISRRLRYRNLSFKSIAQIIGQMCSRREEFPPLKLKGGWTVLSETYAISKYLNILVAPDFICIKSLSNNVLHSIEKDHPNFDRILDKIGKGDEYWDDIFQLIPENPLILRRTKNETRNCL